MRVALQGEGPAALLRLPALRRLLDALDGSGEEARVVGGAVRNALIGRTVTEIDVATTARPDETIRRAMAAGLKSIPTGVAHGTVTVLVDGTPFEVTSLREDVETDGRHAVVRFGRDFATDAQRRDFTINALSLDRSGALHDHTGGLDDLGAGRVRFIGEPGARIREDFLRILRFFRFSAEYALGPLDADGLAAAIRERDGLAILSRERIRAELLKLLGAARATDVLGTMSDSGLLLRLTGGIPEFGRVARIEASDPVGRLAALLVRTVEDADQLRDRLRLSNLEHARLAMFGRLLERLGSVTRLEGAEVRRLAALFDIRPLLLAVDAMAGEPRPSVTPEAGEQIARFRLGGARRPVFRRTGGDLMREGVPPGPELGRRLAAEKQAWLAAGCPD